MKSSAPNAKRKNSVVKPVGEPFVHRVWIGLFALWALVLTGVFSQFTSTPGVWQAWQLERMVDNREEQLAQLEARTQQLERDRKLLETSPVAQEREARRVLGYVAPDELVFDLKPTQIVGK